ncbi:S-type anion channel SLAH4-like [Dioscorea cayenensis subsp. rotundata]|uniref:S-type anion channel SLAH4-like n=1 Tax=Dioscorea cayennensis subsp. rotundata TaxID=55577 RepID=A0AB40CYT4_DIOCR|nr:S-type anion channel SLAH4-like [Dioscorea cayenensis subsp. rotundata]
MEQDHCHLPNILPITISSKKPPPSPPSPSPSSTSSLSSSPISSKITGFHAGYFRISLALCGQALLWKTLSEHTTSDPRELHHLIARLPSISFLLLWSLAFLSLLSLSLLFLIRCFAHFHHVRAELSDYIGMNYLFAPWISYLLLLQSTPFLDRHSPTFILLCLFFSLPVIILDVKIYGQWFTKGRKFLSVVANPTSLLSVIANLAGARASARMGWKESAVCLFSLAMAHYLVLFVTLYQRLQGSNSLPAMLRPAFFLFFAAPSMASFTWASISGHFDISCKMLFFLSLFLFTSLVSRPALFKRSLRKFNIAWWTYSLPVTILALAATEYAQEVKGGISNALMLCLSVLSSIVTLALLVYTVLNAGELIPVDDPFSSVIT